MRGFDPTKHPRGNQTTGHAGQFATKQQTPAAVRLGASRYHRPARTETVGLSDQEVLACARKWVNIHGLRFGLSGADREEALGDVMVDLMKKRHEGVVISARLVNTAARAVASRYVTGPHIRHEDDLAYRMLRDEVDAYRHRHGGRSPSRKWVNRTADDIRAGWHDRRHRPSVGFQDKVLNWGRPMSLDRTLLSDADMTIADVVPAAPDSRTSRVDLGDLSREEWLAEVDQAGVPAPRAMDPRRVRALVTGVDDPVRELRRLRVDGVCDPRVLEPWGHLSQGEQDAVADRIIAAGDRGDGVWRFAVARAADATHIDRERA